MAAFILATAGLTIAGIYARTAQKVRRSLAEAEAAALAEAVRDYADDNLRSGGTVTDTILYSHDSRIPPLFLVNHPYHYFPAEMSERRSNLVWKLAVAPHPDGYAGLHAAMLYMALDDNSDKQYSDADFTQAEVATFAFVLRDY